MSRPKIVTVKCDSETVKEVRLKLPDGTTKTIWSEEADRIKRAADRDDFDWLTGLGRFSQG